MDMKERDKKLTALVLQVAGSHETIDVKDYLNIALSEPYVAEYTATEIGKQLTTPLSGRKVNSLLREHGYLTKDSKGKWKPTPKGEGFALKSPYGYLNDNIITVDFNIKWRYEIVEILNNITENEKVIGGLY